MTGVLVAPEMLATAAHDVAGIGSDLSTAHTAAADATTALPPAAADEVSGVVAKLFSEYAADLHRGVEQFTGQVESFSAGLRTAGGAFAWAEQVITEFLHPPVLMKAVGLWGHEELIKFAASPSFNSLPPTAKETVAVLLLIPNLILDRWAGIPIEGPPNLP